jgi:hypothetical protein
MMAMSRYLAGLGITIAAIGMAIEGLGIFSMTYWPLRRRLPSPFTVLHIGFAVFVAGLGIYALGRTSDE